MPTWRRLVEAVKDDVGGSNPALARTIAGDHPGNHIYCSLLPTHVEDQMCYIHNLCFWYRYTWISVHVLHEAILVDKSL